MEARYAIYIAPLPDTRLWTFGSTVLGYDAATGGEIMGFTLPGYDADAWRQITARPRVYGFHATLKAPFKLGGYTEAQLSEAISAFCAKRPSFRLGPLAVTALTESGADGFVALTPAMASHDLTELERDVVIAFDPFRKTMTVDERAKRQPERLSERQRQYLDTYGYPFVLEEFRFHMTLTGACRDAPGIADLLADNLANRVGTVDLRIDALCLFKQDAPGAAFRIVGRFPLAT